MCLKSKYSRSTNLFQITYSNLKKPNNEGSKYVFTVKFYAINFIDMWRIVYQRTSVELATLLV